ncbi:hypothetical protein [Streptomyces nigrescens]
MTGAGGCAFPSKPGLVVPSSSPTSETFTEPESDVTVTECKVDFADGTLEAKLSVHNGNSRSGATYNGTVVFNDETGDYIGGAVFSVERVGAGETRPFPVSDTFLKGGHEPKHAKCTLRPLLKAHLNG